MVDFITLGQPLRSCQGIELSPLVCKLEPQLMFIVGAFCLGDEQPSLPELQRSAYPLV